jgi:hypothetical protein
MKDAKQALESLLESLGESSQFATSGSLTPVPPGLELKAIGSIGFPISATDAKRLIAKATRAPSRRGEETIVDPKVRRVWQLDPSQFVLRNAEWNEHVNAIVDSIKQEFGIRQKVNAQLYKSFSSMKRGVSSRRIATARSRPACSPLWSSACRRATKGDV